MEKSADMADETDMAHSTRDAKSADEEHMEDGTWHWENMINVTITFFQVSKPKLISNAFCQTKMLLFLHNSIFSKEYF